MVPVVVFTAAFYTGQVSFLSFCADLDLILMMMGYSAASLGAGGGGPFCYCMQRFLIMDGTWKNRFFLLMLLVGFGRLGMREGCLHLV
jgi:hypothetical protein